MARVNLSPAESRAHDQADGEAKSLPLVPRQQSCALINVNFWLLVIRQRSPLAQDRSMTSGFEVPVYMRQSHNKTRHHKGRGQRRSAPAASRSRPLPGDVAGHQCPARRAPAPRGTAACRSAPPAAAAAAADAQPGAALPCMAPTVAAAAPRWRLAVPAHVSISSGGDCPVRRVHEHKQQVIMASKQPRATCAQTPRASM